jgi:hypothetical protein
MMKRVVLFSVGAGMLLVGLFAPTAASADAGSSPDITVTHTAGPGGTQCLPAAMASTATLSDTPQAWIIRITATAPICGPVSAAVYQMPNNIFYPWPQHLLQVESVDVTPGVTTITFTKTCTPTQFDLVAGATPEYINPNTGPMVNLLYAIPWSGMQYWPTASCTGSATTSTLPSTTTSTATSVTTTTVASATTTTVAQGGSSVTTTTTASGVLPNSVVATTTTTTPTAVEPATETKASEPATVGDLAFTGASTQVLIYGGIFLMLFGAATMVASRRRQGPLSTDLVWVEQK